MTETEIRRISLAGLYAERARLWGASGDAGNAARQSGIIAYKPSRWLGRRLKASEPRAFSAELRRMERDGIVRLIRGRRRLRGVQLLGVNIIAEPTPER